MDRSPATRTTHSFRITGLLTAGAVAIAPFSGRLVGPVPLVFFIALGMFFVYKLQFPQGGGLDVPGVAVVIGALGVLTSSFGTSPRRDLLIGLASGFACYMICRRTFRYPAVRQGFLNGVYLLVLLCGGIVVLQSAGFNILITDNPNVESLVLGQVAFRPPGPFENAVFLAQAMAFAAALAFPYAVGAEKGRVRHWVVFLVAVGVAVASLTRVALLAIAVCSLFGWLMSARTSNNRWRAWGMTGIIVLIGLLVMLPVLGLSTELFLGRLSSSSSALSERLVLWEASFRLMLDHPFGVGLGNFPQHILAYQPGVLGAYFFGDHLLVTGGAENMYLTVGAELGVLSVVAYLLLLIRGVRVGLVARRGPEGVALTQFWIAIAIMGITAYGLMRIELGLIFWLALAATEAIATSEETPSSAVADEALRSAA